MTSLAPSSRDGSKSVSFDWRKGGEEEEEEEEDQSFPPTSPTTQAITTRGHKIVENT